MDADQSLSEQDKGRSGLSTGHRDPFDISRGVLMKYRGHDRAVRIPEGVTAIGRNAFVENRQVEEVTIPEGVIRIEERAFYFCSCLRSVSIPEGVTSIGYEAFGWCGSLEDVKLPASLMSLGNSAFASCRSITGIRIPEGITNIGDCVFDLCLDLEEVILPGGVRRIGERAFCCCESLTGMDLPEGLEIIGDQAFRGCRKLEDIRVPEGIRSIGERAFYDCRSLKVLILPESLTYIGKKAFSASCEMEFLRYPRSCDFRACFGDACCSIPYVTIYDPEASLQVRCPVYLGGSLTDLPEKARPGAVRGFVYAREHGIRETEAWKEDYYQYIRDHNRAFAEDAVRSRSFLLFLVREELLDLRTADHLLQVFAGRGDAEGGALVLRYRKDRSGAGDDESLTL